MTAPLLRVRPRCRTLQPRAKVPLYVMLAISLSFAVSFSLVDLLNLYYDRCCPCAPPRSTPLVSTPAQVIWNLPHYGVVRYIRVTQPPAQISLVLACAVGMGAAFGLLFGLMDVEDDTRAHVKLRHEARPHRPCGKFRS